MTLPNFLIIGAPRCGTTSLYEYLQQHPDVFMSEVKEPHFFAFEEDSAPERLPEPDDYIRNFAEYCALFEPGKAKKAIGEASSMYLESHEAPARIHRMIPDARLVALLRNPADRAYSHYTIHREIFIDPAPTFREALEQEPQRIRDGWRSNWRYREHGFYAKHLTNFYKHFDPSQVRVYLFEDLTKRPQETLADLCSFLGIDPSFSFDTSTAHNPSAAPRNPELHKFLLKPSPVRGIVKALVPEKLRVATRDALRQMNREKPAALDEATRQEMLDGYREDIAQLEQLLRRDLSHWFQPKAAKDPAKQSSPENPAGAGASTRT